MVPAGIVYGPYLTVLVYVAACADGATASPTSRNAAARLDTRADRFIAAPPEPTRATLGRGLPGPPATTGTAMAGRGDVSPPGGARLIAPVPLCQHPAPREPGSEMTGR